LVRQTFAIYAAVSVLAFAGLANAETVTFTGSGTASGLDSTGTLASTVTDAPLSFAITIDLAKAAIIGNGANGVFQISVDTGLEAGLPDYAFGNVVVDGVTISIADLSAAYVDIHADTANSFRLSSIGSLGGGGQAELFFLHQEADPAGGLQPFFPLSTHGVPNGTDLCPAFCNGPVGGFPDIYLLELSGPEIHGVAPTGRLNLSLDHLVVTYSGPQPPNPLPEPRTWALAVGGLGLAGAALRRHRAARERQATT